MLYTKGIDPSVKTFRSLTGGIDQQWKKFDFWPILSIHRLKIFFLMMTIDLIDVFCRQSIISIDPIDVFFTIGAQLCPRPCRHFIPGLQMAVKASRQFGNLPINRISPQRTYLCCRAGRTLVVPGQPQDKAKGWWVSKLSAKTRLPLPFRSRWTTTKSISKSAVTVIKKVPK